MARKFDLRSEMYDLSNSFGGFCLTEGEEVKLVFAPLAGTTTEVVARYAKIEDAFQIPLAYGPRCEFYVSIVDATSKEPTPADLTRLLASWRLRERTKDEIELNRPVGRAMSLPFDEPSLQMENIYPVDDGHVCEASFYYHQRRYHNHGKGR
jgi:hypothetical protein